MNKFKPGDIYEFTKASGNTELDYIHRYTNIVKFSAHNHENKYFRTLFEDEKDFDLTIKRRRTLYTSMFREEE